MGSLAGVRVLDCSEGIAGSMAAMYLGDFGAEVLKVEAPAGDATRSDPGFAVWNRNKSSIVLDLDAVDDRMRLQELIRGAHLCVFTASLARLEHFGIDPVSVAALNAACVYLHMPAFARRGPSSNLPESAELMSAWAGVSSSQYSFGSGPVDPVIPHVTYGQAIWAAAAAVAALDERQRTGFGQSLTIGGLHGWLMTMTGSVTRRPGAPDLHAPGGPGGPVPFYRLYECADGEWLFLAALTPAFHTAAFAALGVLEEFLTDQRLGGELLATALPEHAPWVIERVAQAFKARPRSEWLKVLRDAGCPAGPVLSRDEWFDHDQVHAIGMRVAIEDTQRGRVDMPGLPLQLSRTPASIRFGSPTLGSGALPEWPPVPVPRGRALGTRGPLAGIRVLDLGSIIAGTYAGSLLATLGADVIKVEAPNGDNLRNFGPTFFGYNLGKRSLVLDLRKDAGRTAFLGMVAQSDVVVDNYRPGVLNRLGLDYESLCAVNPRIVSVSITGYGEVGPLGQEPGFDPLLQAASGMMRAQGGDHDPVFFLLPVNDVASASTAALGASLALFHRTRSGEGQRVRTSLAAQSIMMQCRELVRFEGRPSPKKGGRDFRGPSMLDRLYETADGWVRLRADGPVSTTEVGRLGLHVPVSESDLETAIRILPTAEVAERLRGTTVAAVPVRTLAQLVEHPEFTSEGVVQRVFLADGSETYASGVFVQFSRTPLPPPSRAPGLGEHSLEVLADFGLSPAQIDALLTERVTVQGSPFTMP